MLFTASVILTSVLADQITYSPISASDFQGFNNIIALATAPADYFISKEIKSAGLDPLAQKISGSASKHQNIGNCNADFGVDYSLGNIRGIASVVLDKLSITKAEKASNGAMKFDLQANTKPFNLDADVTGGVFADCGKLKPHIEIGGDLVAERLILGIQIEALTIPLPNGAWTLNVTVVNVTTDFKDVVIHLTGFNQIFNPLLDFVARAVENQFREKIEATIDAEVTTRVNVLIQDQIGKLAAALHQSFLEVKKFF